MAKTLYWLWDTKLEELSEEKLMVSWVGQLVKEEQCGATGLPLQPSQPPQPFSFAVAPFGSVAALVVALWVFFNTNTRIP